MGEKGPEAIVPLKRGRDGKLGIAGGGGVTTVNVSVDAKGTKVEGDGQQMDRLGRLLGSAIEAELVKQKRPGGLLA
jgi:phage-related minor tail protein